MRSTHLSITRLLTLALLLFISPPIKGSSSAWANTSATAEAEMRPVSPIEYRPMEDADGGMSGDPFQLCLLCRCCAQADPADCSSMSCCFGIDCNLPSKPYGVCAFVPTSCNCSSCLV